MDGVTRQTGAADAQGIGAPGWQIEIEQGPHQGGVVSLEPGEFKIGTELSNDIVLADAGVAGEQATLTVESDGSAVLHSLAAGVTVEGKEVPIGTDVAVPSGAAIHAGGTVMKFRGPRMSRPWWIWALAGIPAVLLLSVGAALVGLISPGQSNAVPRPIPVVSPVTAMSATDAVAAFGQRLRDAGLYDQVRLTPGSGAVTAEGSLSGPDMARWSEQQVWFDGHYKGGLSLVNRVREAAPQEGPNLRISAVSTGSVPYLITANGDRFVEGAVVDGGWTIEHIGADSVMLVRNGQRVELKL